MFLAIDRGEKKTDYKCDHRGGRATSKVGGTNKKGHFLNKKGTYSGKSQSEYIPFFRHWYIPLHCDYIIIRDDFNICFSSYIIQDIA